MNLRCWGLVGLVIAAAAARASAQHPDREFAFGAGYGQLFWDGSNSGGLEEQGGLVLDGRLTWAVSHVAPDAPQLRAGVGLNLAFYPSWEGDEDIDIVDGEVFGTASFYTHLSIIAPRLEIAWRQPINQQLYLEPGLAGVFMVGNFTAGEEFYWFVDEEVNRWRVGGAGKAFLRLAYQQERWGLGVEGSYSYGWLDFGDDIGGDIQQASLSVFYSHRF